MKSLQAYAIENVQELKKLTFLEIVNMCTNESGICNALFSSRDALFSFLKGYIGDRNININKTMIVEKLIRYLNMRDDVNTSKELKDWFVAIIRGYMWNYKVDIDRGWVLVPFYSDTQRTEINFIMEGTLPSANCQIVQFDSSVSYFPKVRKFGQTNGKNGIVTSDFVISKDREDIRFDVKYKTNFYKQVCADLKHKLISLRFNGFVNENFTGMKLIINHKTNLILDLIIEDEDIWVMIVKILTNTFIDFWEENDNFDDKIFIDLEELNDELWLPVIKIQASIACFQFPNSLDQEA